MLTKEMKRLNTALSEFGHAITKLQELRDEFYDAGFVASDLQGCLDPDDLDQLILWLADIHRGATAA
jgi:hypothetical protein